ncbi:Nif11-like leader peptide family natural product precursor [Nostoc sp. ChiQUE01b]|uniref:Nif11-like leader peptide family natural product precursor n=1 Tax=Nostoc sp. ChiQUE01b TaxID=3075376 RepID=UPI002AD4F81D|nr:Nif11-like leader peptide family natural product precursor [Nostoc sp. ChiQUE01b]MDZ8262447.1 Nif11-like leader peptide family natural product precursor [Nostoc sp. ChiQUE01b]
MSLENVQAFYARLANDEAFRAQIQRVTSKDEYSQIVKDAGYDFTQDEFEEYTAQLLESTDGKGELKDLNEKELEAVFGGASSIIGKSPIQQIYGLPVWPPIDWGKPPDAHLMYGVIVSDILDNSL